MMLAPPHDAEEGFVRLDPDLQEIAEFISRSPMSARERERLAIMLADYFTGLVAAYRRPQLKLVHDASRDLTGRIDEGSVHANGTPLRRHEHR